jgi:hypothetical protein
MRRILIVAAVLTGVAGRLAGQAPATGPDRFCFQGQPREACRGFMITEAAYSFRPSRNQLTTTAPGGVVLPSLELGAMRNLSDRVAIGGSVGTGLLDDLYVAVKPRLRVWLSPEWAADISPGYLLKHSDGVSKLTGDVSIMYRDQLGITAQAFVVPVGTYHPEGYLTKDQLTVYLGVRFGSKLGVAGAIGDATAFLAVLGAYIIACGHGGCD